MCVAGAVGGAGSLEVANLVGLGGLYKSVANPNIPQPPKPIVPPKPPTPAAEKIYAAKRDDVDEPQLLGTSALRIPLKTIQ